MKDKFLDFYYEHTKNFWLSLLVVGAVVLGIYMMTLENAESEQASGVVNQTFDYQLQTVQDTFSELMTMPVGYVDQYPAFEVTLFLKKPFITQSDFKAALNSYVELLKYKHNNSDTDTYLSGVRFKIYDRISNYEEGLNPRVTATYQLSNITDEKVLEEYADMVFSDLLWQESLQPKKAPNYQAYSLLDNFVAYNTENTTAFSQQEYTLYKKLLLYEELTGDAGRGLDVFMFWELGIPRSTTEYLPYFDLTDFKAIGRAYNESDAVYKGLKDELYAQLAIENPRLLAYVLTEQVYELKLDAKRALVALDREQFLPIYVEEAQRMVQELSHEEGLMYMEELDSLTETPEMEQSDDSGVSEEEVTYE